MRKRATSQGVERQWESEYDAEFSELRLAAGAGSRDHEFYQTPRSIKSTMSFADHNRVMALEKKLGQRVKERSRYGTNELRRAFKMLDADGSGRLSVVEFTNFLLRWHIECTPDEVQQLLSKYDTDGSGRIDYHEFLAYALPNDFQRELPSFQPLEHRGEWVKWNNYRVHERGKVKI